MISYILLISSMNSNRWGRIRTPALMLKPSDICMLRWKSAFYSKSSLQWTMVSSKSSMRVFFAKFYSNFCGYSYFQLVGVNIWILVWWSLLLAWGIETFAWSTSKSARSEAIKASTNRCDFFVVAGMNSSSSAGRRIWVLCHGIDSSRNLMVERDNSA